MCVILTNDMSRESRGRHRDAAVFEWAEVGWSGVEGSKGMGEVFIGSRGSGRAREHRLREREKL